MVTNNLIPIHNETDLQNKSLEKPKNLQETFSKKNTTQTVTYTGI